MAEMPKEIRLNIDVAVTITSSDGVLDEVILLADLVEEYAKLISFVKRIVELDDPDPESEGFGERRTITLNKIIKEAQGVLGINVD